MDEENSELRSCVPCLRANIERLEEVRTLLGIHFLEVHFLAFLNCLFHHSWPFYFQEKRKLQDETEVMSDRLTEETESRRKMADKLSHERHQNQKEKECTQEVALVSLLVCSK